MLLKRVSIVFTGSLAHSKAQCHANRGIDYGCRAFTSSGPVIKFSFQTAEDLEKAVVLVSLDDIIPIYFKLAMKFNLQSGYTMSITLKQVHVLELPAFTANPNNWP
ncbi:hypothetical protein BDN72DRAFT_901455 [Pluteus cervinus]|uniref:Uncharacterized protein n=1 Tax=Pluteus cervinus TaxID=181527 RepID=A0ACD3AF63_9AGAR|nr:hypothetical protein BDN72DRAFT_901455 [Pluteus cervinus]